MSAVVQVVLGGLRGGEQRKELQGQEAETELGSEAFDVVQAGVQESLYARRDPGAKKIRLGRETGARADAG